MGRHSLWSLVTADQVYLENEAERQEYVLNDTGRVYQGAAKQIQAKPWVFGQVRRIALKHRDVKTNLICGTCHTLVFNLFCIMESIVKK